MILLFDFDIFMDYNKKIEFLKEIAKMGLSSCFVLSEEFDKTNIEIITQDTSLVVLRKSIEDKNAFIYKFLNKYKKETIIFFTNNKNFLLQLEYNQNLYIKNFFSKYTYNYEDINKKNKFDIIKKYIDEMQEKSFITLEEFLLDKTEELVTNNIEISVIIKYIQNLFFEYFVKIKTIKEVACTLEKKLYLNTEKYKKNNDLNKLFQQKQKTFYIDSNKEKIIYILDNFEYFEIDKVDNEEVLNFIKLNNFIIFDKEKIFKILGFMLPNYQDLKLYYWLIDNTKKNISIEFMLEKLLNIDIKIGIDEKMEIKKLIGLKVLFEHIRKMNFFNLRFFPLEKEFEKILDLMNINSYLFDNIEWQKDNNIIKKDIDETIKELKSKGLFLQNTDFNSFLCDENIVYFFKKINIKSKTKNNKIVLNNDELLRYQDNLSANYLNDFLAFKKIRALKYFIQAVKAIKPIDDRIKTTFSSTNTKTGRLTSSEVNLQNISRECVIENFFVSKYIKSNNKSDFIKIDYSQIELRMLAHFSQDNFLIKSFQDGEDIHLNTATELFKFEINKQNVEHYRKIAKAINFGLIYGMGARALSHTIKQPIEIAKNYIERHQNVLNGAVKFIEKLQKEARNNKYIHSLNGRKIYFENGILINKLDRVSINNLCQASASDVIKLAMLVIKRELDIVPLLQIHDELIFDYKAINKVDTIIDIMKNIYSNQYISKHQDLYFNKELNINLDVNIKIDKSI
ncbi:DNA polymerase [Campylobacter sp. RM12651]|uniref:DNA polymerase n=1 Tax=Campylobacter sp. RM12651 TaxID=1660079 RepID=UPI001EFAF5A3|nr:DNA polymerase [Campylobacter sp. RM12651]ULO04483.1 hypothetical protein AVBRAN_a0001 [Campylobacter sp. RM12651]